MTSATTDSDREFDEPELFPRMMIYLTVSLDVGRGWSVTATVQDPMGKNVIQRWNRAGGSLLIGEGKVVGDLQTAWEIAMSNLQVFG